VSDFDRSHIDEALESILYRLRVARCGGAGLASFHEHCVADVETLIDLLDETAKEFLEAQAAHEKAEEKSTNEVEEEIRKYVEALSERDQAQRERNTADTNCARAEAKCRELQAEIERLTAKKQRIRKTQPKEDQPR
jgi:chromosome segregation ATPase